MMRRVPLSHVTSVTRDVARTDVIVLPNFKWSRLKLIEIKKPEKFSNICYSEKQHHNTFLKSISKLFEDDDTSRNFFNRDRKKPQQTIEKKL